MIILGIGMNNVCCIFCDERFVKIKGEVYIGICIIINLNMYIFIIVLFFILCFYNMLLG